MFDYSLNEYYRFLRLMNSPPCATFKPKRSMVIKNRQLQKRRKK